MTQNVMTLLSEFEYSPVYSVEAFERAEKFLETCSKPGGTANFALFGDDVPDIIHNAQACHAGLGKKLTDHHKYSLIATEALYDSANRGRDFRPVKSVDQESRETTRGLRDKGVVDGFFNWFVYESFFGRFILNRDRPSVHYGWIYSTDLPPAITQALAIVSRHFYECLDRAFIKFDELAAEGVPKSVAYMTAFNSYYSYSYGIRKDTEAFTGLYAHRMLSFPKEIETLQNFIEGRCNKGLLNTKTYRERPDLYGTAKLFFNDTGGNVYPSTPFTYELLPRDAELRAFLQDLRGVSASSIPQIINPFKRQSTSSTPDPLNVSYLEMFEIIKFLTKRGDFKNANH